MSIATEISRLQGLRNALRTKLVALGLAQSSAALADCVEAVEGIENRGAVTGSIATKAGAYPVPQGYHNGAGSVSIASAEQQKLIPGNIKMGVTILGVEGAYSGEGVTLQSKTVTPTKAQQHGDRRRGVRRPEPGHRGGHPGQLRRRERRHRRGGGRAGQQDLRGSRTARRRRAPWPTTARCAPPSTASPRPATPSPRGITTARAR